MQVTLSRQPFALNRPTMFYIGLALLFSLMGLAFYNDIHRMLLS